jgi:hypothetical protein
MRRRDAKAKRFRLRFSICNIPEVSLTANRAPLRRSAPGPTLPLSRAFEKRAQSYAAQSFQMLRCAFAQLFTALPAPLGGFVSRPLSRAIEVMEKAARIFCMLILSKRICESILSDFNGLRRNLRVASSLPSPKSRSRAASSQKKGRRVYQRSEKQYQVLPGLARNCRFFLSSALAARP